MQYFYYLDAQRETQGPVLGGQLVELVNTRVIDPDSLVVPAGESQWRPLSQFLQKMEPAPVPLCPETKDFYVHQSGKTFGPYSPNQLDRFWSKNAIRPHDQIARGGGDKWVSLASCTSGAIIGFLAATFQQSSAAAEEGQCCYYYDFGDGETFDAVYLDTNHDGLIDAVGYETNGDGVIDLVAADTNYDGQVDLVASDTNYDGSIDVVVADTNYDGIADVAAVDTDFDGVADIASSDGGIADFLSDWFG
ncbi:MAG: hypothetical protein EXS15_07810 [Phycisphaerales bacterium]|nr:hypothetical protein [Phycisphaerales bacterium]